MNLATAFLYLFAGLAVAGGITLVVSREPIRAAMGLLGTMLSLAGMYALLDAHLMAAFQVLIYAGAIIVLIVYVVMLLGSTAADDFPNDFRRRDLVLALAGTGLLMVLVGFAILSIAAVAPPTLSPAFGTVDSIGKSLMSDYVLAFEVSGALLLSGIIAAIYLTTKEGAER